MIIVKFTREQAIIALGRYALETDSISEENLLKHEHGILLQQGEAGLTIKFLTEAERPISNPQKIVYPDAKKDNKSRV